MPAAPKPQPATRDGFVAIGRVLGSWGLRGALKLESLTDFPERYAPAASLWLAGEQHTVEHCHWQRGAAIVKLSGIDDPEAGRTLRDLLVEIPESDLHPLGEDEYYQHDLLGLAVQTTDGAALGRVTAFLPTGANDVLVLNGERGEWLIPMIANVVQTVDLAAGRIIVELMPGLEPTPSRSARTKERKPRVR